ncbi:MAG: methionine synthase, partial [Comamonas sp.]|nr:methionine synthase [Comamonas sp.]
KHAPVTPRVLGRRVFKNFDLAELAEYIDWGPFFQTWDLAGPYPAILDDEIVGEQARSVQADAKRMLKKIIEGRWLQANGVMGIFPANRVGDDIEFYTDESRTEVLMTWYGMRQQTEKQAVDGVMRPSRCLSDFVASKDSGIADYAGLFAVTAGIGAEKKDKEFEAALDDYSGIMFKALADRLAEAFAECLHARVRKDLWGYAADEVLSNEELIKEQYKGIRPAPGYPACPDHTAKIDLFKVLQAEEIGMTLTESLAMNPASSVSGFYIGNPQASYFNVGQIGEDQLVDMAQRRGMDIEALRRFLAPNLG